MRIMMRMDLVGKRNFERKVVGLEVILEELLSEVGEQPG